MLGRSTGVSLAVVTSLPELRRKSQREHLQLLPKVILFLFYRCFIKQTALPGFKNLTRFTSRDILLRLSWVTVHQVRGARCCPRGGSTLSRAGRNKAGPQQCAQAACKKKKKNSGQLRPTDGHCRLQRVCDHLIFFRLIETALGKHSRAGP